MLARSPRGNTQIEMLRRRRGYVVSVSSPRSAAYREFPNRDSAAAYVRRQNARFRKQGITLYRESA